MMMMTVRKIMMVMMASTMPMIMTVMVMIHSYDKKRNDEQGEFNVSKRFY